MPKNVHLPSRVLKLLISMGFFAAVTARRATARLLGRAPAPTCVVLYYHSIAPECRKAFAQQMDTVLQLTTVVDCEQEPTLLPGNRYSAITFDDAFRDAIENAVPELVSRRLHATIFVTLGVLGKLAEWWPLSDPERTREIATVEQIRSLPRPWIGVGAHTVTHPHLSALEEPEARREIAEPKQRLESMVGYAIRSLSFPYGDFDEDVIRWSREAGYERAFTTQHQNAFEAPDTFLVGRVKAEPTDWDLEFRLKLLGGYLWLPQAIALKRRIRTAFSGNGMLGAPMAKNSAIREGKSSFDRRTTKTSTF
jgi:peptidoglycan/xylan/chitin deacetylase (PgdA/CDA1 family)